MNLEELITDLKAAGASENTIKLAMNCYDLGKKEILYMPPYPMAQEAVDSFQKRLADEIDKMPFGDTAASFAAFVRGFK